MARLLHETLTESAARRPGAPSVTRDGGETLSHEALAARALATARGLAALGVERGDRVAFYLPKTLESVLTIFGSSAAGAAFVPVNPLLKPHQVAHILADAEPRVLVTAPERAGLLADVLAQAPPSLTHVVLAGPDREPSSPGGAGPKLLAWDDLLAAGEEGRSLPRLIDQDMVAILYTSGSTGRPKGVVLSHRNIVTGAETVTEYLEVTERDVVLAVLPFSFDYGLNQLTGAVYRGAHCVLMDYLLPRDVIRAVVRHRVTGLAGVPPLWTQLAPLEWPEEARRSLRYITNTGGTMPEHALALLREKLPRTRPFLMYGLTEAFRSTYLPPEKIDERRGSIGKAIPNAEILVVNEQGELCGPDEPGELVHRGALVSLGYWRDPERTAERFRPLPPSRAGLPREEIAVWSGDTVRMDADGYLYFVGRNDAMIKTSGYRVSPEEVEEVVYGSGAVVQAVAIGVPHPTLGQAIVVVATPREGAENVEETVLDACRRMLPGYMVPRQVIVQERLPHTPNGKLDRNALRDAHQGLFEEASA